MIKRLLLVSQGLKTTLLNLFLGLFEPSSGKIMIDDIQLSKNNRFSWNKYISLIPQETVTFHETIEDNIAYFLDKYEIDNKALKSALIKSNLHNKVESFQVLNLMLGITEINSVADKINVYQSQDVFMRIERCLFG